MSGSHDWAGADEILTEARRIVSTDRNVLNGNPEDNFHYIALGWSASLQARGLLTKEQFLTEGDVARLMVVFKMMRDSNASHRDNRTDAVGYTCCLERVDPTE